MAAVCSRHPPPPTPRTSGNEAAVCSRHPQPPTPRTSGLGKSEEAYKLSSQQLRDIIEKLQQQQENISQSLHIPVTTDMVIDFVKEVDYGDRYWDMTQYLAELPIFCSIKNWRTNPYLRDLPIVETSDSVFDAYIKKLDQDEKKFDLDEIDIWHCVSCHIADLEGKISRKRQAKEIPPFGDATEEKVEPPTDEYALEHPIWKLVLQARKNEYVMNKNPRLELQRIIDFVPLHYFRHNTCNVPRDQEKTVMVPNVTPHTSMWEVKNLLSGCGEIDFSEVESGRGKPRTIYIIFKDLQGAKAALEKKFLDVDGRLVNIKLPQPDIVPHKVPLAAQEVEALIKYRRLIAKFAQLSNDVKEDVSGVEGAERSAINIENAKKEVKPTLNPKLSNDVKEDVSGVKGAERSAINIENAKKEVKPEKKHSRKKVRTRGGARVFRR